MADGLARVRARIRAAALAAGRPPEDVSLIVVTKTYPAEDVAHLVALGVADVGENRDQEAAPKAAAVAAAGPAPRWHFIGRLQRNKARSVVGYADAVHSVDSVRLAAALAAAAGPARPAPLDVFVQVSLDGVPGRGGALPDDPDPDAGLDPVLAAVASAPALRLRGLMAVAPLGDGADVAFDRLHRIADRVRSAYPGATLLSAGMSGDLEAAVACGATHVRVGSAVLGKRAVPG
ncbi:YggS family pyridoxal phosphate-dependent enzyme [Pilimelia anulata]|uniref:YggS family pyridoxal phosphate-dependent enzyme n=1 Tax=Pilimelia anulata TaxID=53371 RepID=UPI001E3E8E51|nr:YggS family pyridoxal phosphate-dependent enzyme [Pilimelia anulata]